MAFMTLNITHEGQRGRPSHPHEHEYRAERVLNEQGQELGTVAFEAGKNGSVVLTVITPKGEETVTIPGKRPSKARKVTAARKARKRTAK